MEGVRRGLRLWWLRCWFDFCESIFLFALCCRWFFWMCASFQRDFTLWWIIYVNIDIRSHRLFHLIGVFGHVSKLLIDELRDLIKFYNEILISIVFPFFFFSIECLFFYKVELEFINGSNKYLINFQKNI